MDIFTGTCNSMGQISIPEVDTVWVKSCPGLKQGTIT